MDRITQYFLCRESSESEPGALTPLRFLCAQNTWKLTYNGAHCAMAEYTFEPLRHTFDLSTRDGESESGDPTTGTRTV